MPCLKRERQAQHPLDPLRSLKSQVPEEHKRSPLHFAWLQKSELKAGLCGAILSSVPSYQLHLYKDNSTAKHFTST